MDAQNFGILLFEDFDDSSMPAGWTQTTNQTFPTGISSTIPSDGWAFGEGPYSSSFWDVPASVDGTPFAISNDDPTDQNRLEDLLLSPIMEMTHFDSAIFLYDVFYDSLYQVSEGYFLISYDTGVSWLNLPLTATTLNDGWVEDGFILPNTITVGGNQYTFNDQMRIGFLHTDNGGWGTGVAIDNVIVAGYNNPCDDIVTIPQCNTPQTVTLGGQGIVDFNFTGPCLYDLPGAEQLYSFTPSVTGVHNIVVSSATGTSFLDYLYKPASMGCDSVGWNCVSDVTAAGTYGGLPLVAGTEYYILVDNEFSDSETQTFFIECPCSYTSGGNTPESEPCGDDFNGGCLNNGSPTYESIACGASISGTVWADAGTRDTDWFELVVTENTTIEVDFGGAPPMVASLFDDCANIGTPLVTETTLACGSGTLTYAVTPGTYLLALFPQTFFGYPCGSGGNDYDVTVTYCEPPAVNPCLTSADTWVDLNNNGAAPCNDGNGCTPTDAGFTTFGIYGSETYLLDNVQAGYDYVFDMCSGVGAGSWIPEIAIVAPDGTTVDAWNGEAATGSSITFLDNCSIGWTATQSGTYSIIINELGTAAGDAPNQVDCNTSYAVDNGNPTVECGVNEAPCLPCEAGALTSPLYQEICPGELALVVLDGTQSSPGDFALGFSDVLGGTGGLAGGFTVTGYTSGDFPFDFDDDVNGVLSANSLDPLLGEWVVTVYARDGGVPCDSTGTMTVNFLEASDPNCITVGVVAMEDEISVKVYPNPSNGEFIIEVEDVYGRLDLNVLDMMGRVIHTQSHMVNTGTVKETLHLDMAGGTYLLQIVTDSGISSQRLEIR